MHRSHRTLQHVNGDFHWFVHTRFCRIVAQVVIVALVLVDAPFRVLEHAFAQSVTVFGPEDFVRRTGGKVQPVTRNFTVPDPSGSATLCLLNGGQNGQYVRVSSGLVTLNNVQVLSKPSDFNPNVVRITRPVTLKASNKLVVELRSTVGSGFTLSLVRGGSNNCPSANNRPPVANAGPDQSWKVGTLVTLDGSGSTDVDGNALTYLWSFVTKPAGSTATLSDPNAIKPTFTIDKPGTYTVQLVVNDGTVNSIADTVDISTSNSPPVANAGADQSELVGTLVTLNGSGSTDVDGDGLTYLWSLTVPAGSTATLSDPNAVNPTFTIDKPGMYTAQLIVNDGMVESEPDTVVISTTNSKPVADAGEDQTQALNTAVTLDGRNSQDVDGDPLTYRWALLSVPAGSTATLDTTVPAQPTFVLDKPGTYTAQLIVNDGTVDSDPPDTVVISTRNSRPVADAGEDQIATVNQLVTLDGSGSTDADNDALTYRWSFTTTPDTSTATLSDPTAQKPTFTPHQPGLYIAQLIVRDGKEDSDPPGTVNITVSAANQPPTITSTPVTTATVGQAYSYDVDATDPDAGDTLAYSLTTKPTGMTINSGTGLIAWTPIADQVGPQNVTVEVSDGHTGGTDTQSFTVTVSAEGPTNQPPTIISTPVTTAQVGQAYSYDVDATDPDTGDTLAYSLTTKPTGMTIDASTGVISWTPAANQTGTKDVTVQASDGHTGGTDSQSFTITVNPAQANRAPTAQDDQYAVRRRQSLTVPAPGVLQNDSDPDNNPLTAQSVTGPTKGTANLAGDGSFTYTPTEPPANSTEPDLKFTYRDADTTLCCTRSQPLVVDLDKDGVAEIVFDAFGPFARRKLIALHGNDGSVAFSVNAFQPTATPPIVIGDPFSELAAGDIDGDGFPEIIAVDAHDGGPTDIFRRQLLAFEHNGTYKWTSQDVVEDPLIDSTSGFAKPLIADINGDGTPEIVVGYAAKGPQTPAGVASEDYVTVFDSQGQILWTARGGGSSEGLNPATGVVVAHDIDLDGDLEILFSDDVFDHQGNLLRSAATCLSCLRVKDVAVANLDADPFPEIVYLDNFDQLYVYEHTGGKKWGPLDTGSGSSLLTIGDADGDGKAEILLTSGTNIVVTAGDGASSRLIPVPFSTIFNLGNTTIFDLNGDGKPELIHLGARGPFDTGAQLGAVFIFDGQTGTHLYSIKSPNGGNNERPVVADVDGDGAAEIVTGGWNGSPLLHVFEAKNGQWAKARPIYNQYNYHVTNVNSDGTIPARPAINWLTPGLNNYRVNIPLPEERTGDKDQFTYKANDGALDSNTATVRIDILPPNSAPSILSQPPTAASPNLEYLYAVRAVDPDAGEVLTFSLSQAPAGMTINTATGLTRWTPTAGQLGNHVIALKVTDSQGEFVFQGFTITVVGAQVTVPDVVGQTQATAQTTLTGAGLTVGTVTNSPSTTVPAGRVMSQEPAFGTAVPSGSSVNLVVSSGSPPDPNATDNDGDGFSENQGDCDDANPSRNPGAADSQGDGIDQNCDGVDGVLAITSIVVEPIDPLILTGDTQAFTATGILAGGTSQNITNIVIWTSSNTAVATIASTGVATGVADGTTTITATRGGSSASTTLTVRTRAVGDSILPIATITAPAADAEVTSPSNIVGTASDANFLKYELDYAPAGETTFTPLATGTTAVTNGVLGQFDPTLLINDLYTIRLTVFDTGGNQATTSITVQVSRELKVGLFTITFQDLNIALSGLPITVNRTYDSRDKGQGDFGIGWQLDVQTLRIRTNRVLGTGWVRSQSGAVINLSPTDAHKVSLTLPDGKVEEFDMQVSPTSGFGGLDFTNVVGFTPRPGTLGTLEALANNSLLILNAGLEDELVDDGTLNTYNPQLFRYTTVDGTQIEIHRTEGVKKVTDLNGNTLTFGPTGIIHSAGKSVTFTRDAQNRITQITDPSGNSQSYAYNANGDLISHTDQLSNVTRFFYNNRHDLLQILDPLNRNAIRNEYDANGRLIAQIDAAGKRIEYTHDINTRQEVLRDRLGNTTVLEYDTAGNVTATTDALGNRSTFTYDGQGNQLTSRDPLGNTTSFTYDNARRLLSRTDPLGNVTRFTYDAAGRLLTMTDPLGNATTNTYDTRGNVLTTTDGAGGVRRFTYDAAGNALTVQDAAGNTTQLTYSVAGFLSSATDPEGVTATFTRDAMGNLLTDTHTLTTQAGSSPVAWSYGYDAKGNATRITGPVSSTPITVEWNAVGQIAGSTDPLGNQWQAQYDAVGNLSGRTIPGQPALQVNHDAEGQETGANLPDGGVLQRTFDPLGRAIQITMPGLGQSTQSWDAASRMTSRTDPLGNATAFSYDAAGRRISETKPGGAVTTYGYDTAGRVTSITDPTGRVYQYAYDGVGRTTRTTLPDGTQRPISYNGNGQIVSRTGIFGDTWSYTYSPNGQVESVRDPAGNTTTYGHDSHSVIDRVTDAQGRISTFVHDALGRPLRRTLPEGQTSMCAYDTLGRRTSCTDFAGTTTQFAYDDTARSFQRTAPDGTEQRFFNPDNQLARVVDSRGTTTFGRDSGDRLTSWTGPDGTAVQYSRDTAGRVTAITTTAGTTTLTYNARGELASVVDPGGTTSYTRDLAGRPTMVTFANGLTLTNTYDTNGRITRITYTSAANTVLVDLQYTRDTSGRISRILEATGRDVTYSYDTLGRVSQEQIADSSGPIETIAYEYDVSGNPTRRTDSAGVQVFTYDSNDRLLSDGTSTYTWDANGNLTSRTSGATIETFTYDSQNRLLQFVRTGTNATTIDYVYDVDGLLASRSVNGVQTRLVWDRASSMFPQLLEERDATNALMRRYEHGEWALTHVRDAGGSTSFFLNDHLGTVRATAATNGSVTAQFSYDAFGRPQGASPSGIGYTNGYTDPGTGLIFMRSRWYAPTLARFIHTDSAPADVLDPRTLNRYVYSLDDPVNHFDPTGQETVIELSQVTQIITYLAVAFTGQALVSIGRQSGWGFGIRNVLEHKFERFDATIFPIAPSLSLGGGVAGFTGGVELLNFFNLKKYALYFYFGSEFSSPSGSLLSAKLSVDLFAPVYNTPEPRHYNGWFVNVSGSKGQLPSFISEIGGPLTSGLSGGAGPAITFFWSPTPTYQVYDKIGGIAETCPTGGCTPRHGHGFKVGPSGAGSVSFSISLTYYFLLDEFDAPKFLTY